MKNVQLGTYKRPKKNFGKLWEKINPEKNKIKMVKNAISATALPLTQIKITVRKHKTKIL